MTSRTDSWPNAIDAAILNDDLLNDIVLDAKMARSMELPKAETRRDAYHAMNTGKKGIRRSLQFETMEHRLAMSGLTDAAWPQPASMPQGALGQIEVHALSSEDEHTQEIINGVDPLLTEPSQPDSPTKRIIQDALTLLDSFGTTTESIAWNEESTIRALHRQEVHNQRSVLQHALDHHDTLLRSETDNALRIALETLDATRTRERVLPAIHLTAYAMNTAQLRIHSVDMPPGRAITIGNARINLPEGSGILMINCADVSTAPERIVFRASLINTATNAVEIEDLGGFGIQGGRHTYTHKAGYKSQTSSSNRDLVAIAHERLLPLAPEDESRYQALSSALSDLRASSDQEIASHILAGQRALFGDAAPASIPVYEQRVHQEMIDMLFAASTRLAETLLQEARTAYDPLSEHASIDAMRRQSDLLKEAEQLLQIMRVCNLSDTDRNTVEMSLRALEAKNAYTLALVEMLETREMQEGDWTAVQQLIDVNRALATLESNRPMKTIIPGISVMNIPNRADVLFVSYDGMPEGVSLQMGDVIVPVDPQKTSMHFPFTSFTHHDRRVYPLRILHNGTDIGETLGSYGLMNGAHTYNGSASASIPSVIQLTHQVPLPFTSAQELEHSLLRTRGDALSGELGMSLPAQTSLPEQQEVAPIESRILVQGQRGNHLFLTVDSPHDESLVTFTQGDIFGRQILKHPGGARGMPVMLTANPGMPTGRYGIYLTNPEGTIFFDQMLLDWDSRQGTRTMLQLEDVVDEPRLEPFDAMLSLTNVRPSDYYLNNNLMWALVGYTNDLPAPYDFWVDKNYHQVVEDKYPEYRKENRMAEIARRHAENPRTSYTNHRRAYDWEVRDMKRAVREGLVEYAHAVGTILRTAMEMLIKVRNGQAQIDQTIIDNAYRPWSSTTPKGRLLKPLAEFGITLPDPRNIIPAAAQILGMHWKDLIWFQDAQNVIEDDKQKADQERYEMQKRGYDEDAQGNWYVVDADRYLRARMSDFGVNTLNELAEHLRGDGDGSNVIASIVASANISPQAIQESSLLAGSKNVLLASMGFIQDAGSDANGKSMIGKELTTMRNILGSLATIDDPRISSLDSAGKNRLALEMASFYGKGEVVNVEMVAINLLDKMLEQGMAAGTLAQALHQITNEYVLPENMRMTLLESDGSWMEYGEFVTGSYLVASGTTDIMIGPQTGAGSGVFKPTVSLGTGNAYWEKTLNQVIYGNFTNDVTGAGVMIQIGLGFTGVDIVGDLRDIAWDLYNWEWTWGHAGQTGLDGIGVLPVIGVIKNVKNVDEVLVLFKNGDKVEVLRGTAKKGYEQFLEVADIMDIEALEKGIGHVITNHVGKSDEFLKARIAAGEVKASTFTNAAIAREVIYSTLQQRKADIIKWIENAEPNVPQSFKYIPSSQKVLGRIMKSDYSWEDAENALIVLVKRLDGTVYLHTSYVTKL